MQRYHSAWSTAVALVGLLCLFVAVERLGLTAAATVYVLSAALVAALAAALERGGTPTSWHAAVRTGIVGGAVSLAVFGTVFLLGPGALLVLLVVVVFSPRVLRRFRRLWVGHDRGLRSPDLHAPAHGADPVDIVDAVDPVGIADTVDTMGTVLPSADAETSAPESMSDAALCWAWRRSYGGLRRSRSVAARLRVVQQRQRYLDELERRNPDGLSGWLSSGARAAGDPSRFIVDSADPDEPPAA